jgi:hypothetical protein
LVALNKGWPDSTAFFMPNVDWANFGKKAENVSWACGDVGVSVFLPDAN